MKANRTFILGVAIACTMMGALPANGKNNSYDNMDATVMLQGRNTTSTQRVYSVASDGYTNIHRGPSTSDRIIGEIRNGKGSANIIGSSGNWYKVNYNGIVGYVHKSQVKVIR